MLYENLKLGSSLVVNSFLRKLCIVRFWIRRLALPCRPRAGHVPSAPAHVAAPGQSLLPLHRGHLDFVPCSGFYFLFSETDLPLSNFLFFVFQCSLGVAASRASLRKCLPHALCVVLGINRLRTAAPFSPQTARL